MVHDLLIIDLDFVGVAKKFKEILSLHECGRFETVMERHVTVCVTLCFSSEKNQVAGGLPSNV